MLKSWKERKIKERKRKSTQTRLPGFELALLHQLLASAKQTKQKKRWISECQDQSRNLPS